MHLPYFSTKDLNVNFGRLLSGLTGKERFSGAVEALSKKNIASSPHRDHSRHRISDDLTSSKHVVNFQLPIKC